MAIKYLIFNSKTFTLSYMLDIVYFGFTTLNTLNHMHLFRDMVTALKAKDFSSLDDVDVTIHPPI